jgi:hypothetical protein
MLRNRYIGGLVGPACQQEILVLAISIMFSSPVLSAQTVRDGDSTKWREDLAFLASELPKEHKNLFHAMSQAWFEAGIAALESSIPNLERHEIIVDMARIVNAVGDGHSGIRLFADPSVGSTSACAIKKSGSAL